MLFNPTPGYIIYCGLETTASAIAGRTGFKFKGYLIRREGTKMDPLDHIASTQDGGIFPIGPLRPYKTADSFGPNILWAENANKSG